MRLALGLVAASLFLGACTDKGSDKATEERLKKLEEQNEQLTQVLKYRANLDVAAEYQKLQAELKMDTATQNIPLDGSPSEGPANAKVTIVEFSDMQCPYCSMRAPMVKAMVEKYPTQVRVVYKHFPLDFHKAAPGAHAAARAAEKQGKFWPYRYAMAARYSEGQKFDPANLAPEALLKLASDLGLNMDQFKADMALDAEDAQIFQRDMALGAQIGVRGTPTYFVNGRKADKFGMELIDSLVNAK